MGSASCIKCGITYPNAGYVNCPLCKAKEVQVRHLATIRMLTMDEATAKEVEELRAQVAALIAKVGTVRALGTQAVGNARILAHCYERDHRPPGGVVAEALAYPVYAAEAFE